MALTKTRPNGTGKIVGKPFTLSEGEFDQIRALVKQHTGIHLSDQKRSLVLSRLTRRLRSLGLANFTEYIKVLQGPGAEEELLNMINRITTNKTDFYRENHHFEFMTKTLLPGLVSQAQRTGQKKVRIWSAGCSSGEEPYTLAITLAEFFKNLPGWDYKILATDLDTNMLRKASAGVYDARLLEPVPRDKLNRYFTQNRGDGADTYTVSQKLRDLIIFRKFNLMSPTYPVKVPLDAVFCRNVLIYFTNQDRVRIVTNFHRVIKPGGYMFVGHSESLRQVNELFKYTGTTVYQRI